MATAAGTRPCSASLSLIGRSIARAPSPSDIAAANLDEPNTTCDQFPPGGSQASALLEMLGKAVRPREVAGRYGIENQANPARRKPADAHRPDT